MEKKNDFEKLLFKTLDYFMLLVKGFVLVICLGLIYIAFGDSLKSVFEKPVFVKAKSEQAGSDSDLVKNGIHVQTGLVYAEGFEEVRAICTSCHSAKMVTQNRATREGWIQMIRWMQETQGLWQLGPAEPKILDYLAKHYAPEAVGRRSNLDIAEIEWFILELDEE
jgi:hypothetical protein